MCCAKRVTLYRGIGLPPKAISLYQNMLDGKTDNHFSFTAFTSTSLKKEVALKFAYKAWLRDELNPHKTKEEKQVPILFVIKARQDTGRGSGKSFLHDDTLSAFKEEQEVLYCAEEMHVSDIKTETHQGLEVDDHERAGKKEIPSFKLTTIVLK